MRPKALEEAELFLRAAVTDVVLAQCPGAEESHRTQVQNALAKLNMALASLREAGQ